MKKLLIKYPLIAALTFLLLGCDKSKNIEKNNAIEQKGNINMKRKKIDSGLEYEVIQEGTGVSPKKGQQVTVHYTGWLDNNGELGVKFDSSLDRKEPFTFVIGIGQVIKGWDQGVMLMKIGEKRRLIIPSNLGYGARGAGRLIPPHATLIFDVELLNIN